MHTANLNWLRCNNTFVCGNFRVFTYKTRSSATLLILLHTCQLRYLISFACLISLARTFRTILNRIDGSRHPFLAPHLTGEAFSFSSLSINFVMEIYGFYLIEEFSFWVWGVLSRKGEFCWMLFLYKLRWSCGFYPLYSVNMLYHINWFSPVKLSFHSRNKSHLTMV